MSRSTICRMCGEPFKPKGEEHVCQPCIAELDELEASTQLNGAYTNTKDNNQTEKQCQSP